MKKKLGLILSLLMCVSVIGVGFAAWIITDDASESANGNITVEEVVDKRLSISGGYNDTEDDTKYYLNNESIVFGTPTEEDKTGWLQIIQLDGEEAQTQVLETTLKFEVGNYVNCTSLTVNFAVDAEDQANVDKAVNKGYIVLPENDELTYTSITTDIDTLTMTDGVVEVTYTFAWGAAFGGNNPFTYFNASVKSDSNSNGGVRGTDLVPTGDNAIEGVTTNGDYANYVLTDLENLLEGVGFTITIDATSTTN